MTEEKKPRFRLTVGEAAVLAGESTTLASAAAEALRLAAAQVADKQRARRDEVPLPLPFDLYAHTVAMQEAHRRRCIQIAGDEERERIRVREAHEELKRCELAASTEPAQVAPAPAPSASAPAASPAEPVRFADLPRVMAEAMHADPMARAGARINLEAELVEMVASGRLKVRDSLTHGPHSYPVGDALKNAVLLPDEVRQLLAERGVNLPAVAHPMTTERQAVSSSPPVPPYSRALRDLGKALDALAVPSFEAIPEPVAAPAEAVADGERETAEARQGRRLMELRSMGADCVPHGEGWRVTGRRGALAGLVKREAGQPMDTKDGVRKDLRAAVQRERGRNGRLSR